MSKLLQGIVECNEISSWYLRFPTNSDARRMVHFHQVRVSTKKHGINGCLGSLDAKVHGLTCPSGWKGQFQGKEGYPRIGHEAVADNNLWLCHSAFGYAVILNDINMWDWSPLYEAMIDGSHSNIDFACVINGEQFAERYYLVDGIHPSLSCFLATINDPSTKHDCFYAPKQEGWRKSIERAFGVWKKKFLLVGKGTMLHHRDDIFYLVKATIVRHNMMVDVRTDDMEMESDHYYKVPQEVDDVIMATDHEISVKESPGDCEPTETVFGPFNLSDSCDNQLKYNIIQQRCKKLYSASSSINLQDAVKKHVFKKYFGDDGT
jgi:hypothetical protein